jgi:putative flippase GtrA
MKLTIMYAILALIATAVNIAAQDLVIRYLSSGYAVTLSIMVGTAVGLLCKYILDKRYIFRFKAANIKHDGQTFVLYTLMGLATTAIFWGFEFGFHHLFDEKLMRYLGAVIGLAIGYFAKYHLDKRYVFSRQNL